MWWWLSVNVVEAICECGGGYLLIWWWLYLWRIYLNIVEASVNVMEAICKSGGGYLRIRQRLFVNVVETIYDIGPLLSQS
jgi:hypothetical protein